MSADLVSGEGYFLLHRWCLLVVFSHDWGGLVSWLSGISFLRAPVSIVRALPS